jgi:signal peptidase I
MPMNPLKVRKPWIAFGLSSVCPGLGQLYNGNWKLAVAALGVGIIFGVVSTVYFFDSFSKLMQALALSLLIDTIFGIQAFLEARRIKAMELKPYQRWWIYIGFAVIAYGLPDGYGKLYPSRFLSFQIPSESMVPNLLVGDRLVADGWAYWGKDPQRGDIVVFDFPRDPSIKYVKRMVGLPGDTVEVRGGELFLNGEQVKQRRSDEPNTLTNGWVQVEFWEKLGNSEHRIHRVQPSANTEFPPTKVPEGKFFVMGDNRDRSSDSRVWGFVDRELLIGKMSYIFFSWDSELSTIRTDRIGAEVH